MESPINLTHKERMSLLDEALLQLVTLTSAYMVERLSKEDFDKVIQCSKEFWLFVRDTTETTQEELREKYKFVTDLYLKELKDLEEAMIAIQEMSQQRVLN